MMKAPEIRVGEETALPSYAKGCVISIGKFDGVHRGHQALARTARELADGLGTKSLAVTFDPLPLAVLRPDLKLGPPLTPLDRKISLLRKFGYDDVAVFRTGAWLLDLEAREFFDRIVRGRFQAVGLVEGPDFTFGRNRSGSGRVLADWCVTEGIRYVEVPPVMIDDTAVTSSSVRRSLSEGDLRSVNAQLGHSIVTRGVVARGAGRGRSIDTPTANLIDCDTLLPGPGVYAASGRVLVDERVAPDWRPAAVNIGTQPTFSSEEPRVEVHLVGEPDRDLYGCTVEVAWLRKIRDTIRFETIDSLRLQIASDIGECKRIHESEGLK